MDWLQNDWERIEREWPTPNESSPFMTAFAFEIYEVSTLVTLVREHRSSVLALCALYVLAIAIGRHLMRRREALELRRVLLLWNTLIAVLSIVGFSRTFPETLYSLRQPTGLYGTICRFENHNYATGFWAIVFTLLKVVEFGDTAFIVLRKQPLIFLHWYHHITVLLLTWVSFEAYDPAFRIFGPMNYFVHSFMYPYYALKSQRFNIPRKFAMALTTTQIFQMIIGFSISVYTMYTLSVDNTCYRSWWNAWMGLSVYGSYFVLFLNYFVKAYFSTRPPKIKSN